MFHQYSISERVDEKICVFLLIKLHKKFIKICLEFKFDLLSLRRYKQWIKLKTNFYKFFMQLDKQKDTDFFINSL
jgi:hypothetical protein